MVPGYKHVQAFGPDEEYEDEGEVSYVTLDLGNNVDRTLLPNTYEYRLIGLDTPTPMLQLSGTFFKGRHEQLVGTELLFTAGRDEENPSRRFVVPVATTEQRIKFEQVEVRDKVAGGDDIVEGEVPQKSRGKATRKGKEPEKVGGRKKGKGKDKAPAAPPPLQQGETILDLDTPMEDAS